MAPQVVEQCGEDTHVPVITLRTERLDLVVGLPVGELCTGHGGLKLGDRAAEVER